MDAAGAIARYTEVVDTLEIFDRSLSREAADPSVAGLASGLYSLSVVREEDAYVQAVVAAGIAAGRIDAPSIDQARNATLRRSIAVDDFRSAVGTDNAGLADAVVGPDVDNRDLLAQVVLGRGAAGLPLQVSGPDWERASSAVEDRDAATSEQLRGQLQEQAGALQQAARNGAGVASVILLLALMAGAAVVFFVTRSLLRPLRLLRRSALDVAERRLPQAVRSLREGEAPDTTIVPTPITTREEIGQVARAFDQVHEQAVRLAAEQAGLRSAFNSIFVNLSRRSQALVERQLRLIEQLENSEEDPEALSNLFQLDHLATRMRRNSENLLVLSGTDLSRRGSRPVPLVDVLRAAASEVEQYQRIDLAPPPSAQLLGRTASDVVHLVAELLENATTFSAPDTRVRVQATQNGDGSLLVEIIDSGVGMSEEDLHDANVRLDSPPTVDVSASRRMGLFVVGRLATRHGITVSLRNREDGGVAATALVPASAVLAVAPEGAATPAVTAGASAGASRSVPDQARGGGYRAAAARPAPGWRRARVVLRARRRPRAGWRGRRPSRRRPRAPVDAAAARVVHRGARHQRLQRLQRPRDERHERVGRGPPAPPAPAVREDRPARDVPGPRPPSRPRARPRAGRGARDPRDARRGHGRRRRRRAGRAGSSRPGRRCCRRWGRGPDRCGRRPPSQPPFRGRRRGRRPRRGGARGRRRRRGGRRRRRRAGVRRGGRGPARPASHRARARSGSARSGAWAGARPDALSPRRGWTGRTRLGSPRTSRRPARRTAPRLARPRRPSRPRPGRPRLGTAARGSRTARRRRPADVERRARRAPARTGPGRVRRGAGRGRGRRREPGRDAGRGVGRVPGRGPGGRSGRRAGRGVARGRRAERDPGGRGTAADASRDLPAASPGRAAPAAGGREPGRRDDGDARRPDPGARAGRRGAGGRGRRRARRRARH